MLQCFFKASFWHRLLSWFWLFSFGFFFSNFSTTSILRCDTLTRISGGSSGPKRFQFNGKVRHASPERALSGWKSQKNCIPGTYPSLRAQRLKQFKILKCSSEIENFNFKRAAHQTPIFCGEFWRSRAKISIEIENFKRDLIFSIFGPLGLIKIWSQL